MNFASVVSSAIMFTAMLIACISAEKIDASLGSVADLFLPFYVPAASTPASLFDPSVYSFI